MKRQIIVTINADEKTCGKCRGLFYGECGMFYRREYEQWVNTKLSRDGISADGSGESFRCAACIAAEKKARGGK